MQIPRATRPVFPPGYIENPQGFVAWEWVEGRLKDEKNYWLGSTRPDGRPHVVPKWMVWVGGQLYFDGSPQIRHARNLAANPAAVVHLGNGDEVVILEGVVHALDRPEAALAQAVAAEYTRKYERFGYSPQPDQWDAGGLFAVSPVQVITWSEFTKDPTKFRFEAV